MRIYHVFQDHLNQQHHLQYLQDELELFEPHLKILLLLFNEIKILKKKKPLSLYRKISPLSQIIINSSLNSPGNCGVNDIWSGNVSPGRRSSVGEAISNGANWTVSLRTTV